MNLEEVLNFRRSVRVFDKEKPIKPETVKHCLQLATLAPNSSNMQLWEFYQITNPELLADISKASWAVSYCYGFRNSCFRYTSGSV